MSTIDARVRLPQDLRPGSRHVAPTRQTEQYDRVLGLNDKLESGTMERLLASLAEYEVTHAVIHAETEGGEDVEALNDAVASTVEDHPDRFTGVGAADIFRDTPGSMARQAARIAERGLVGVSVQPAFAGMDIDDRRLYPLYARCEELRLIVFMHTGITYSRMHPIRHERAELLDQVACDFPDLKLVACHAGWPYVAEYCAVARRHPTVYLEFGGLAPRYVAKHGTGWDPLFGMMANVLREQVIYGSDWPVMDHGRGLQEWRDSGLDDATLKALLRANSASLLGIE